MVTELRGEAIDVATSPDLAILDVKVWWKEELVPATSENPAVADVLQAAPLPVFGYIGTRPKESAEHPFVPVQYKADERRDMILGYVRYDSRVCMSFKDA